MSTSNEPDSRAPLVVGVDGSAAADLAVDWAADAAARENRVLHVVGAVDPQLGRFSPGTMLPPDVVESVNADTAAAVREAVDRARRVTSGITVSGHVATGAPSAVLTRAGDEAAAVVVGTRHLSGAKGLFLGSVSANVAAHSASPVAVVAGEPGTGPVVAGVDGSALTRPVLEAAFAQAALRSAPLVVVHAWTDLRDESLDRHDVEPTILAAMHDDARERVTDWVAQVAPAHPEVAVDTVVAADGPVHRLLDVARDAGLIVMGSRGRGGFTGLLLGSTSQSVLHHADRPVLIVKGAGHTA